MDASDWAGTIFYPVTSYVMSLKSFVLAQTCHAILSIYLSINSISSIYLSTYCIYCVRLSVLHILFSVVPSDDRSSAASGLDVADRLTYLEHRMQMQEDEIQLLKMALADVLKRLNISEEHQAAGTTAGRRAPGAKGEQRSVYFDEDSCFYSGDLVEKN